MPFMSRPLFILLLQPFSNSQINFCVSMFPLPTPPHSLHLIPPRNFSRSHILFPSIPSHLCMSFPLCLSLIGYPFRHKHAKQHLQINMWAYTLANVLSFCVNILVVVSLYLKHVLLVLTLFYSLIRGVPQHVPDMHTETKRDWKCDLRWRLVIQWWSKAAHSMCGGMRMMSLLCPCNRPFPLGVAALNQVC